MEAVEQVGRQHDSFEEIDRILVIVEQAKREYDTINAEKQSRMVVAMYLPLLLSIIGVSFSVYELITHKQSLLNQLFFFIPFLIFLFIEVKNTLAYDKVIDEKKRKYEVVNSQAGEVLREIIPIVSQRESWSAIKKFEIRLRLSKLAISPADILDDKLV